MAILHHKNVYAYLLSSKEISQTWSSYNATSKSPELK